MNVFKKNLQQTGNLANDAAYNTCLIDQCELLTEQVVETFRGNGTVFFAGNGGSHCDALHVAEEFTGRFRQNRRPLAALALGEATHSSCVGNDFGFEHGISRQLLALARPGDLFVVLSTSGNSKNLLEALHTAHYHGIDTFALLGRTGGEILNHTRFVIVPGETSDRIQELHMTILHSLVEDVERRMFPELYQS